MPICFEGWNRDTEQCWNYCKAKNVIFFFTYRKFSSVTGDFYWIFFFSLYRYLAYSLSFCRTPRGLEDVSRYPELFAELLRNGKWTVVDLKKVAGLNLLRVLRQVNLNLAWTTPTSNAWKINKILLLELHKRWIFKNR